MLLNTRRFSTIDPATAETISAVTAQTTD